MAEEKKYLEGFSAIQIIKHIYPGTIELMVVDLQMQIDSCNTYKDNGFNHGVKISDHELHEIDADISEKTVYVKSLLTLYADYNWPSKKMQDLCRYYGIKTFNDNERAWEINITS